MVHSARLRVIDGIANVEEAAQQLAKGEPGRVSAPSFPPRTTPGADATGLAMTPLAYATGVAMTPGADATGLAVKVYSRLLEADAVSFSWRERTPLSLKPPLAAPTTKHGYR
jgi:hypothetical protein